jgi:hypothetical protein
MWHWWGVLSTGFGGGDVALLGGVIGHRRDQRARPSMAQIWALTGGLDDGGGGRVSVVVVADGGGGEKKARMVTMCDVGDISTMVARFGNSQ